MKKGRLLITSIVVFAIIGIIFASTTRDSSLNFQLTTASFTGNVEVPNIECNFNVVAEVQDENGDVIATEKSPFLTANPVTAFSLIDKESKSSFSGFNIIPETKCNVDGNVPIIVKPSDLLIKVYAQDAEGNQFEVWNGMMKTKQVTLKDGKHQELGEQKIRAVDLLKFLPDGDYDSWHEITVQGQLRIVYEVIPDVPPFLLGISEDDAPNFRLISVTVDNADDGDVGGIDCAIGEVKKGNVCINPTGNDGNPNSNNVNSYPTNDFGTFFVCAFATVDKSCLASANYIPWYLGSLGLLMVFLATKKQTSNAVYGTPMGY